MTVDPLQSKPRRRMGDCQVGAAPRRLVASAPVTAMMPPGKPYAVPVRDLPARGGWLVEGGYRVFEIIVALTGLILSLPLLLILTAVIRWDTPGPAVFFQPRTKRSAIVRGRDLEGRGDVRAPPGGYDPDALYHVPAAFAFPKFRTMYVDARQRFPALYDYRFPGGEFRKQYSHPRDDPRITPAGRILRKLSVDELPNLWSVLVGKMRLVGPRPEILEVLQHYTAEEMYKFACKPGITGLAQVNGRALLNWGDTIAWDLQYLHTRSVKLDLKILLLTLKAVILRRGAF